MKKCVVVVLTMVMLFIFSGCSNNSALYEEAYEDGYRDGFADGENSLSVDDAYAEGFSDGQSKTKKELPDMSDYFYMIETEAVDSSIDFGGWHPEEAWGIIESYENNDASFWGDRVPTKSEYHEAVHSLIGFYEYFYSGNHRDAFEYYFVP